MAGIAAVLAACGASSKSPSTTLSATTTMTKTEVVTTQTSGPTSIILKFADPAENSLYVQMSGQPGLRPRLDPGDLRQRPPRASLHRAPRRGQDSVEG
jgi:hypothetical protein